MCLLRKLNVWKSELRRTQDITQTIDKLKFNKVLYIFVIMLCLLFYEGKKQLLKRYLKGRKKNRNKGSEASQKIEKVSLGKLIRITAPNNYSTKSQNNDCILLLSCTNK